MTAPYAMGIGVARCCAGERGAPEWLDVRFFGLQCVDTLPPACRLPSIGSLLVRGQDAVQPYITHFDELAGITLSGDSWYFAGDGTVQQPQTPWQQHPCWVLVAVDLTQPPDHQLDALLRLTLLSARRVRPRTVELAGIFPLLKTLAWTHIGPMLPKHVLAYRRYIALAGDSTELQVRSLDKFPPMTDYVVPTDVRIANTANVRLGAYLGPGTTVMHAGFVNFNAGSDGAAMIEGRISAGIRLGKDSDLGGGASTMGTLSGGNDIVVSLGERCLIGANAGINIPLGDACTVEAGLYLTAGQRVLERDARGTPLGVKKAREFAGQSHLLFLRNSETGAVECRPNTKAVALNPDLHATP